MGQSLENDPRLKAAINMFARRAVSGMAASYGGSIVKLVSETVRRWDAQTITDRLETTVGRDLQYIRINGTLVGGMVGARAARARRDLRGLRPQPAERLHLRSNWLRGSHS